MKIIFSTTFLIALLPSQILAAPIDIAQTPIFVSSAVPPLNMLVMGRDHKLYYEAYNDASDLDGDGIIDIGYKPKKINYYGYFDSGRCYTYSENSKRFNPGKEANDKKCSGQWSGDFLNYLTTSRMDALRKVFYGGYRVTDTTSTTILERAHIPQDAHSWGKEYLSEYHDGYKISDYTPLHQPAAGTRHLFANTTINGSNGSWGPRLRYITSSTFRIWEWVSIERPVAGNDCVRGSDNRRTRCGTIKDLRVQVAVCVEGKLEENCQTYPNGKSKPTGILHDFGETEKMYFGLLTGSYEQNTAGGTLRSNIGSFKDEINREDGRLIKEGGIVATINNLKTIDFTSSGEYNVKCGWITNGAISDGQCSMWGNPIGEMMYETLRYFAGASSAHSAYDIGNNSKDRKELSLPKPTWTPPYKSTKSGGGGYPSCSIPVMTVVSDINPSYDYKLPGSNWGSFSGTGPSSISDLNVSTEVDKIWESEGGGSRSIFIGESNNVNDNAPTAKIVNNLSTVRGLAPEEPTKQGTYYSAGVARFGANNKIGGDRNLMTYSVALASPLPKIEFPVDGNIVTVVPFAKSVGGSGISNRKTSFQPTNQIVDYYVSKIANTDPDGSDKDPNINNGRPYAEFRINYEDVEQGADHDMDAIALYTLAVNADRELDISLRSEYAAGGIQQYMGYVISGTKKDGVYLEICDLRDNTTNSGRTDKNDCEAKVEYHLNTPEGKDPGFCSIISWHNREECTGLPSNASRTFSPSTIAGASILNNPLWYAAKYGVPSRDTSKITGDPDNYFLVTNALTLKEQLTKAFNDIMQKNTAVTRPAVGRAPNGGQITDNRDVYRTEFQIERWSGDLIKETLNVQSNQRNEVWRASENLPSSRNILMANRDGDGLQGFTWENLFGRSFNGKDLQGLLNRDQSGEVDGLGPDRINFIKGDRSKEGVTFRRRDSLLGDIVNSSPVLVAGAQYLGYLADAIDGTAGTYTAFQEVNGSCPVTANEDGSTTVEPGPSCREPMIYVGANDGMLHGFDARTGAERFAFIPTAVIEHLNKLTSPDYQGSDSETSLHQYYVDGSLVVRDVYFDSAWHTVLIGTLGAGGRGAFALDVTKPDAISLLWEFTSDSADSLSDPKNPESLSDLGYTFGTPLIARLHTGQWGVLLNNGYNSPNAESGKAVLFVLDVKTGALIRKLDAEGVPGNNGLSTVRGADNNGDGVLDYVYAGDLQGNMWRFDLLRNNRPESTPFTREDDTDSAKLDFEVSFDGTPLYRAISGNGTAQPITAPPSLVRHPSRKGYLVLFGTGRYLANQDKIAPYDMQSLYGVWDTQTKGEAALTTEPLSRSKLQQQSITLQNLDATIGNEETSTRTLAIRLLSQNSVNWVGQANPAKGENGEILPQHWGWYLDLVVSNESGQTDPASIGERMVDDMAARGQVLLLSTRTPNENPCEAGVEGWLYGINPFTGGATKFNVFDLNSDRVIDSEDGYSETSSQAVVSSYKVPAGSFTLSDSKLLTPDGAAIDVNFGPNSSGRQNWYIVNPVAEQEID